MFKKVSLLTAGLLLSVSAFALDVKATTQKANMGDVQAQAELADYYKKRQDYDNEFYWTQKLANQGNAQAQYNLGIMYENGQGVRQNYRTAKEWFGKACDNGDQDGCDSYRRLNEQGY